MSAEAIFGKDITVRYKPKSPGGRCLEENLTVRELPLSRMPAYMKAAEDVVDMCALLMGRDREWVDKLTLDSVKEIVEEGTELNKGFFAQWVELQGNMQTAILKVMQAKGSD